MTTVLPWLLVAAAVLIVPIPGRRASPRSGAGSGPVTSTGARDRPGGRPSRLLFAAAVPAVGCACVALLGLGTGLFAAAVVCPAVAVTIRRLPRAEPVQVDGALALTLDLAAAALRAGRPLADALARAAPVASPGTAELLTKVAGLLQLGAEPALAWMAVPPGTPLAGVAASATRSATSGIRVAAAFERAAGQIRADLAAAAAVRASRAGVFAMAPLGLCFLPSFVCLGVVPVVVGIAKSAFVVLR